ncbi:MAG: hypothetical protein EZS28_017094, partial [Streblomastix strix]
MHSQSVLQEKVHLDIFLTAVPKYGIVASKMILKNKLDYREIQSAINLGKQKEFSIFILKYLVLTYGGLYSILHLEYANMDTLNIIARQPQIKLETHTLRALMKQILEGMRAFHSAGLVHRDIKCDNILLHSPPGSGRVHTKISDFGFTEIEDINSKQTNFFWSKELLQKPVISTQKADMDIKCDNILLHSPPGSGRVHTKISDFGFTEIEDINSKQTNFFWNTSLY